MFKIPVVGTKVGSGNVEVARARAANSHHLDNEKEPVCGDNTVGARYSLVPVFYGQYSRTFLFSPEDKLARTELRKDIARELSH